MPADSADGDENCQEVPGQPDEGDDEDEEDTKAKRLKARQATVGCLSPTEAAAFLEGIPLNDAGEILEGMALERKAATIAAISEEKREDLSQMVDRRTRSQSTASAPASVVDRNTSLSSWHTGRSADIDDEEAFNAQTEARRVTLECLSVEEAANFLSTLTTREVSALMSATNKDLLAKFWNALPQNVKSELVATLDPDVVREVQAKHGETQKALSTSTVEFAENTVAPKSDPDNTTPEQHCATNDGTEPVSAPPRDPLEIPLIREAELCESGATKTTTASTVEAGCSEDEPSGTEDDMRSQSQRELKELDRDAAESSEGPAEPKAGIMEFDISSHSDGSVEMWRSPRSGMEDYFPPPTPPPTEFNPPARSQPIGFAGFEANLRDVSLTPPTTTPQPDIVAAWVIRNNQASRGSNGIVAARPGQYEWEAVDDSLEALEERLDREFNGPQISRVTPETERLAQANYINRIPQVDIAAVVENMMPEEIAGVLPHLPSARVRAVLATMSSEKREVVRQCMLPSTARRIGLVEEPRHEPSTPSSTRSISKTLSSEFPATSAKVTTALGVAGAAAAVGAVVAKEKSARAADAMRGVAGRARSSEFGERAADAGEKAAVAAGTAAIRARAGLVHAAEMVKSSEVPGKAAVAAASMASTARCKTARAMDAAGKARGAAASKLTSAEARNKLAGAADVAKVGFSSVSNGVASFVRSRRS